MYQKRYLITFWILLATLFCLVAQNAAQAQDIFVGHYFSPGDIGQFSNDGTPIRSLSGGSGFQPYGIAFGPDGFLYSGDGAHPRIDKFDPSSGQFVGTVGTVGAGQFVSGQDGFLYANSGETIYKINTATNSQQAVFSLGFVGGGMAFRPDNGNLLVANLGPAGNRGSDIREFSMTTRQQVGVYATGYYSPLGITFGPDGRLYTAEYYSNTIRVVGANGGASTPFATGGANLSYVAFDNGGILFATSYGTNQVLKFDATTGALVDHFYSGINSFGLAIKTNAVPEPGSMALLAGVLCTSVYLVQTTHRKRATQSAPPANRKGGSRFGIN